HRLGWPDRTAHGALHGRAGIRTPCSDGGAARRRLSLADRYARPQHGAGRGAARHPHRGDRHAGLHLAFDLGTKELVMTLAAEALAIGYPGRTIARDVSVAVAPGEALALLGPNGGGKTTLLKTMLGLLAPHAGAVSLDGRLLSAFSVAERARQIGYV